jgi:hypothetical protein
VISPRWLLCLLTLTGIGCSPQQARGINPEPSEIPVPRPEVTTSLPTPVAAPVAPRPYLPLKHITVNVGGVQLDGVQFDSRTHRLEVADQPNGPGSKWLDSQAAARASGGLAAINAGFFTPEGKPLGLVVTAGEGRGGWNGDSSLGSGIWYEDPAGRSAIVRREKLGKAGAKKMRELIQAGPMLIERKAAVGGLDDVKSSARIVLLWDGSSRWLMARTSPCTLAGLSRALAGASPAGWPVSTALNLDGGRSAELWISDHVSGGGGFTRPIWNKPVRNFLVLKPRR